MEFLITTIVAVILLVGVVSSCPMDCTCGNSPCGLQVSCASKGLDSIPTDLPSDTCTLTLANNDISVIEENAFNNLLKLEQLRLDNNDISVIEENTFNNLPNLGDLTLANNKISVIEEKAFNNLPNLSQLTMVDNTISFVSGEAFVNVPKLAFTFDMHCGSCNNIPFWRWFKLNHGYVSSVTCNDFNGKQLSILQQNDFGCPGNDGNGSVWCSRHGLVYMFFMISLQYIMSNI